ncbi:MAG: trypsin-like peptidase domain-containing protein [Phycisphaerales bacterium]|nr:trypsin-like peptidase domain-containing protein [Phycisphaerales bacterium]
MSAACQPVLPSTCRHLVLRAAGLFAVAGLVVAAPAPASDDATVLLRDGQRISAPVLHESAERVVIDLGFDVLSIPRRYVLEINVEAATTAPSAPAEVRETDDLYSTARLAPQSVKQLAERFGEGVVLVSTASGTGSGFFISPAGHVVTNFHVIEGETRISVTIFRKVGGEFRRDKREEVDIVATNPFLDLALIRVNLPADYTPVVTYLAAQDELRDGDPVFAIGNPLGLERSVSQGIVSRLNRAEQGLAYIQTTTQINPGNSGGPLFDSRGQVVGVTNMKIMGGEGLGFAIPVRYLIDFLKNREAFAYNSESSEAGFRYLQPAARDLTEPPAFLRPRALPDSERRK